MNQKRYHATSIFFHWAIFLLMALALAAIEYRGFLPKGDPDKKIILHNHMLFGQLVFVFVVLRVASRFSFGVPSALSGSRWQIWVAHAMHALLYLVMFALPITGVLFTQAGGKEVDFLGWVLPHFIAPDKALKGSIKEVHEFIGNAVYYLVGLHILGALWHQFWLKDGTLRRMWFGAAK